MIEAGLIILLSLAELILCVQGHSISGREGMSKQKERDFFSGTHHVDTLTWAVQLNAPSQTLISDELTAMASQVAMETGLVNMGQLGSLKGLFLFVHDLHNVSYKFHALDKGEQSSHPSTKIVTPSEMEGMKRSGVHENETNTNPPITHDGDDNDRLSVEAWETVRDSVHKKLNWHRHVKWHLQETVRPRNVRSLDFDDPSFPQQWHLVSSIVTDHI